MNGDNFLAIFYSQKEYPNHNEDAWAVSKKLPIYSVADGVTLKIPPGEPYPDPSGAKIVADLFCQKSIEFLEQHFDQLSNDQLKLAYQYANKAIGEFNAQEGKTYSTVASLVIVKNGKILGSRVTDCGFALLRNGKLIFKTPEFWSWNKAQGKSGYGLINGQMQVADYIDLYNLDYQPGDMLVLFSDGFENHFSVGGFVELFTGGDLAQLESRIKQIDSTLTEKEEINNKKYGLERTLLIIKL